MNETEKMIAALQKELKITRYCSLFVGILLFAVMVCSVYAVKEVSPAIRAMEEMKPAMEQLEQLDITMLNEKIGQLDMEGLNEMIQEVDAEQLSETLTNLNEAAALLKQVGEGLDAFSHSFSGLFGKGN